MHKHNGCWFVIFFVLLAALWISQCVCGTLWVPVLLSSSDKMSVFQRGNKQKKHHWPYVHRNGMKNGSFFFNLNSCLFLKNSAGKSITGPIHKNGLKIGIFNPLLHLISWPISGRLDTEKLQKYNFECCHFVHSSLFQSHLQVQSNLCTCGCKSSAPLLCSHSLWTIIVSNSKLPSLFKPGVRIYLCMLHLLLVM